VKPRLQRFDHGAARLALAIRAETWSKRTASRSVSKVVTERQRS